MKAIKKYIILFLIISSVHAAFPFAPGDSVTSNSEEVIDIRAIVQNEIENARKKQSNLEHSSTLPGIVKFESAGITSADQPGNSSSGYINRIDNRIIILASAFIIASILVAYRRIRYAKKREDNTELQLKRKISMIRNEEPFFLEDNELSEVRKNLRYASMLIDRDERNNKAAIINVESVNAAGRKKTEKDISITAKQLQIAKGEILLASKIRALELKNA
jgi:hypothetical protein